MRKGRSRNHYVVRFDTGCIDIADEGRYLKEDYGVDCVDSDERSVHESRNSLC